MFYTDTKKKNVTPTCKVMHISPALAQEWLLKTVGNRTLKEDYIQMYAKEMREGEFLVNNDNICFDYNGALINGHHRLTAVIRSKKTVQMGVTFGLDPRSFLNMDTTINRRTTGDALTILKVTNASAKAAIAKFYLDYKRGRFYDNGGITRSGISNSELVDFSMKNNKKLEDVHSFTSKFTRNFKAIHPRYIGALYWILSEKDQDLANHFFDAYGRDSGLPASHPIYILRQKLIKDFSSSKKYSSSTKIAFTIIAWNYLRMGKKSVTRFNWNPNTDDFPKPM